jgi:hypothetical protein
LTSKLFVGEQFTRALKNIKERVASWAIERYRNIYPFLEDVEKELEGMVDGLVLDPSGEDSLVKLN